MQVNKNPCNFVGGQTQGRTITFLEGQGGGYEKFSNASNFFLYLFIFKQFFQENVALNNFFSTFVSWICDFATDFNNT